MNQNSKDHLEKIYKKALEKSVDSFSTLTEKEKNALDEILENSEKSKGLLTVAITSIFYKVENPNQDIRKHQAQIPSGYAGRRFDTQIITPFLKEKQFPAMAESGWLTRSLEQPYPYNLDYQGKITPPNLKTSFLTILDLLEKGGDGENYLLYLFSGLSQKRDSQLIRLARPNNLPIKTIADYVGEHFCSKYKSSGAARLPVLAIYAAYECLIDELKRFSGKQLLPIESHTSADARSGRVGDIDVVNEETKPFEAVEIKHNIEISLQLVKDAFSKFKTTQVERYYILSTSGIKESEKNEIYQFIESIRTSHGCQLVVNGVEDSLKYYLRLLETPSDFIEKYASLLEKDEAIKFEHREKWNEIAGG